MAEPISSNYINVNYDSKPDTSKRNKTLEFNKDVNQDKNFDKGTTSDKFKNSPLLLEKKNLKGNAQKHINSVSPDIDQKILNSPPVQSGSPSPSNLREEKILNSPQSTRSSRSGSQSHEFRLVNPASRSGSISSEIPSPIPLNPETDTHTRPPPRPVANSDDDSLGDAEILDLVTDDVASPPMSRERSASIEDNTNNQSVEILSHDPEPELYDNHPEVDSDAVNESFDRTISLGDVTINESQSTINDNEANANEDDIIKELKLICDNSTEDKDDEIRVVRSNTTFNRDETLSGLLDIPDLNDGLGLSDDNIENLSEVMALWIDESISNLQGLLKRSLPSANNKGLLFPSIRLHPPTPKVAPRTPAHNTPDSSTVSATTTTTTTAVMKPNSAASSPSIRASHTFVRKTRPPKYATPSDPAVMVPDIANEHSPLSRFNHPLLEQKLAAKLSLNHDDDYRKRHTSPYDSKTKSISQSTSGDFTNSSRTSPYGDYYSSYNSEVYSRSYTPSYTHSDVSDVSEECSVPSSPDGIRRSSSGNIPKIAYKGLRAPLRPGNIRGGFRGRATGIQRLRPSLSNERLGLVESSSGESFYSNTGEDISPESDISLPPSGLRKPTRGGLNPRGRGGIGRGGGGRGGAKRPAPATTKGIETKTAPVRKQPLAPSSTNTIVKKPGGLQQSTTATAKPSRLQKPGTTGGGIPRPSGITKPRGSGIARPGLRKPAPSKARQKNWDDGCF